ncbi:MAG: hypothetical protein GY756_23235, partial [bacterium]|nr:hypothetical protein [bacterium]
MTDKNLYQPIETYIEREKLFSSSLLVLKKKYNIFSLVRLFSFLAAVVSAGVFINFDMYLYGFISG